MSGHPPRTPALPPRIRLLLGSVALAVAATTQALAQVASAPIALGSEERLTLKRTGTFEVWRDSTRLGTEFYREWLTPNRDSVIAMSTVRYNMRDGRGAYLYQKSTLSVVRTLDLYPHVYQAVDQYGERQVATRVSLTDTVLSVYHEEGGGGRGTGVSLPVGRLSIFDSSQYQQIESIASEFRDHGSRERMQNVFLPAQDTIVSVRIVRGPREKRTVPGWGKVELDRIELLDAWTVIRAWIDDRGRMLELEAPAQALRLVRLLPGEREQQAAAFAKGPPLPGNPPPPHLR